MSNSLLKIAIPVGLAVGSAALVATGVFGPVGFIGLATAAEIGLGAGLLIDSFVFKSKQVTTNQQIPSFQFASAQEGAPVIIIFGTTRIAGNYIRFDPNLTGTQAITQKAAGGKGGGGGIFGGGGQQEQTVGYIYSAPSEYGLCAGPIDAVGEVYTAPNSNKVLDLKQTALGNGTISGTAGTNIITGSGTTFMSQLKQGAVLRVGTTDITDTGGTDPTAYTVYKIIDDTHVQTYESISTNFTANSYTIRNVIIAVVPFGGADYLNLGLSGSTNEGGTFRIYKGSGTQTRISGSDPWGTGDVMNYRWTCFGIFLSGYQVGQQPTQNTYQFELQRMPKCIDDTGAIIAGIITRGSLDPNNICYQDANPAALLFEMLTNPIWGLRRKAAELDIPSFVQASYALAQNNIGMSFPVDSSQTFADVVNMVKQHCSCSVFDTLTSVKCRWLYDTTGDSYQVKAQLTKSSLKDFQHSRKAWGTQVNEIRAQFVNRTNYYAVEVVNVQDLASIIAAGTTRSAQVNFIGFSNSDVAQRMAQRILREAAYPQATVQFTMNRWNGYLEQYDLFSVYWDDWTDNPYTSYYRVLTAEYMEDGEGGIKITAVEDQSFVPNTGDASFSVPVFPYLNMTPTGDSQSNLSPEPIISVPSIAPVLGLELNCYATPFVPRAAFAFERAASNISSAQFAWSVLAANNFTTLGSLPAFAVTGKLATAYPVTPAFDRSTAMNIALNNASNDLATILGANSVIAPTDHFQNLLGTANCFLIIDQEIMQVGYAQDLGGGNVKLTNIIRGCYGTDIVSHPVNAPIWYIPTFDFSAFTEKLTGMDSDALAGTPAIEFQAIGIANSTPSKTPIQIFVNPDETVRYLGNRPFAPSIFTPASVLAGTPGSTTFTVAFGLRPRAISFGAGTGTFLIEMQRTGSPVDPATEFRVQQFDVGGAQIGTGYDLLTPYQTIVNSDANLNTTGLVNFSGYVCQPNAKTLKIYSVVNGWPCMVPLTLPLNV